jgi:aryl-alcohol dehydrogenase-like predicted oxidoreductase
MSAMATTQGDHRGEPAARAAGSVVLGGDVTVCRMGFGARWLPQAGADGARNLLRRVLELGIQLIDTADVYGNGRSEELIAEALHPYPGDLVIATKGGLFTRDGQSGVDGTLEHLRAACEASLRRLRLDTIPLYQLHAPDPEVPVAESVGALVELQREGKIRHIGVSNLRGPRFDKALATAPVVSVQNRYNVAQRVSDPEVERCDAEGIAFLPWEPLADPNGALTEIAVSRGLAPAQVALAWLLARSPAMLVIPGTSSVEHLEQNVAAASLELTPEELTALEGDQPVSS